MSLSGLEVIDFQGFSTAVVRFSDVPISELASCMDKAFTALGEAMQAGHFKPAGPAFAKYEQPPAETVTFETGFPLDAPLTASLTTDVGDVVASSLPASRLAITKYTGPYDGLAEAWQEFMKDVHGRGLKPTMPFWEAYDTVPGPDVDPATLITGLAVPVVE